MFEQTKALCQKFLDMGIPCFACTPEKLPQLLERALKGQDLTALMTDKNR